MKKITWLQGIAVPAVLTLSLGGALIAVAPANAAPADLTVVTTNVTTGRVLTITGTATPGDNIELLTPTGGFAVPRSVVPASGDYSFTYTIPASVMSPANYTVQQLVGLNDDGSAVVPVTIPAPAPVFAVTTPTNGATETSRTVTFSGTGTEGEPVNILNAAGTRIVQADPDAQGNWTGTYTFADTDDVTQNLTANEPNVGAGGAPQAFTITLPAVAPSNALTLTSPADGSTTASRTVTFTGTAPEGSIVSVTDSNGVVTKTDGSITGTTYSIPVTFADDAPVAETVTVSSQSGGRGADNTITRSFNLPAAAPVSDNTLTLATPTEGSTTATRTVTFTGTAPEGSIVSVTAADGTVTRTDGSITGTTYSIPVTFADDAPVAETVTVSSFAGGRGADNTVTRSFNLPAAVTAPVPTIATPVITSPKTGAKITGDQVTFTGTGTPGANIVVAVVPTADVKAAAIQRLAAPAAATPAATPADPAAPIVVNAKGVWSVTVALTPNDYTAEAASFLLAADGTPVVDANGDPVVAGPSNDVEFTLAAAVTTAATGPTTPIATATAASASADGSSLAFTGSNPAPAVGFAGILLALGGAFAFIARRRRRGMSN
ncbi:hypothetical protein AX769_20890 (plasmid) [Frondihabitans sp. PAMC 28766]|uniref:hypothetical protein n=1 Tax=Frondihabitans sp. PAMC 28766 TaxID=1795630 RepID=UPI00078D46B3|nr:hypothetical protein [Frondihabitans sp. PAMC 28766]AMM22602.1 hypothetical protein AX769_20890 [Frondihabitans sp. PAMC 28766]